MSPAEENALVEQSLIESTMQSDANVRFTLGDAIRLAIRAAYAQGREDAAKYQRDLAAAQEARDQVLAIARELARLATCMDAIPQGSIGTQVDKLRLLEERIARETEFDNATRNA